VNGVWTRYPCGVACGAGELVEQTSDLSGSQWTTSALYLQGISLVRRNNEWHHFDPLGTAQVITNNSAQVVSNNVYDIFGVLRYEQGTAQTPCLGAVGTRAEEGLSWWGSRGVALLPRVAITTQIPTSWEDCFRKCKDLLRLCLPRKELRDLCDWLCSRFFPKPKPPDQPKPTPEPPKEGEPPKCPEGQLYYDIKCDKGTMKGCRLPNEHVCCMSDGRPYVGPDGTKCDPPKMPVEPAPQVGR
jgi:hypothetical protein